MCEHLQIFPHIIKPSTSKTYREIQGDLIYHLKTHKNSLHIVDLFEDTHRKGTHVTPATGDPTPPSAFQGYPPTHVHEHMYMKKNLLNL